MTVLANRNKSRWIKQMRQRDLVWKHGSLWSKFNWSSVVLLKRILAQVK